MKNMYTKMLAAKNLIDEIRAVATTGSYVADHEANLEKATYIYRQMNNGVINMCTIGLIKGGDLFAAGTAGFGIAVKKCYKMNPVSFVSGLAILGGSIVLNATIRRQVEKDLQELFKEFGIDGHMAIYDGFAAFMESGLEQLSNILTEIYDLEDCDCTGDIDEMDLCEDNAIEAAEKEESKEEPEIAGEYEAQPEPEEPHEPNAFEVFEEAREEAQKAEEAFNEASEAIEYTPEP